MHTAVTLANRTQLGEVAALRVDMKFFLCHNYLLFIFIFVHLVEYELIQ